jgi:hypothetical protein
MTQRIGRLAIALLILAAIVLAIWCLAPGRTGSALESLFTQSHRLAKEPWLQGPSPTAVTIHYETDAPGRGLVQFSAAGNLYQTSPAELYDTLNYGSGTGYLYRARLTGLHPGMAYRYRVVHECDGGGRIRSAAATFETWPEAPQRVTFIAYGDSRSGTDIHAQIARQFNQYHPAFILHTGDAVDWGSEMAEWKPQFFEPLGCILGRVPIFIACGNHDGTAEDLKHWFDLPGGRTWYSFETGPVHVTVLDSYEQGPEVAEWLEKDLAAARTPWKFIMFHVPVSPSAYYISDFDRQSLLPLLDKHRVDVVLAGHDHCYERFVPLKISPGSDHAVTLVTTGGGGAMLYPLFSQVHDAFAVSEHHFCVFTVEAGQLDLKVFGAGGNELDRLTVKKIDGRLDPAYLGEAKTWEFPER